MTRGSEINILGAIIYLFKEVQGTTLNMNNYEGSEHLRASDLDPLMKNRINKRSGDSIFFRFYSDFVIRHP